MLPRARRCAPSCRRASCCRRSRPRSARAAPSGTPAPPADVRASAAGNTWAPPPQRRRTSRCLHHPQPARACTTQRSDNTHEKHKARRPPRALLRKRWLQAPRRSLTSVEVVAAVNIPLTCAPRRSRPRSITSAVYSQVGWASARASPRRRSSPARAGSWSTRRNPAAIASTDGVSHHSAASPSTSGSDAIGAHTTGVPDAMLSSRGYAEALVSRRVAERCGTREQARPLLVADRATCTTPGSSGGRSRPTTTSVGRVP